MAELKRIKDQLRRSFEGEAWHGPSVLEALEKVTAEKAAARPLARANTTWEIVLHMTSTMELVLSRLQGDSTPLSPEQDWPSVADTSEGAWLSSLAALKRSYSELCQALSQVSDSLLDQAILPGYSSLYVTLHGLVQHNLYHAGQIALLKRA